MKKARYGAISIFALCSIALVSVSANAETTDFNYFKVKASDSDDPSITATAGLEGLNDDDSGSTTPGGETDLGNPTVVNTLTCGDVKVEVTQGMLDHSKKNEELLASGASPVPYPQGGWLFVSKVVTTNEASINSQIGGFSEDELKSMGIASTNIASYVFSDSPNFDISANPVEEPSYNGANVVMKNSVETSFDAARSGFTSNNGTTPAFISNVQLIKEDGSSFPGMGICQVMYLKDNLLHNDSGAAFYSEDADLGYDMSSEVYATNGVIYKENGPAYTVTNEGQKTLQASYFKPNGEEYSYTMPAWQGTDSRLITTQGLSHLSRVEKLNQRETSTYKTCSEVIDCDKGDSLQNPVGRENSFTETGTRTSTNVGDLADEPITTTYWYRDYQDNKEGWAIASVMVSDSTGVKVAESYENARGNSSNLNGPACVERGKDEKPFNYGYFIDGKEFFNQEDYEAAGGKNWQGRFINGLNDEGNPLVGARLCNK